MRNDVKTVSFAVIGTGLSFGLAHINLLLSSIAAVGTIIFTATRIFDWIEGRINKHRQIPDGN